jgi:hypothetical protein
MALHTSMTGDEHLRNVNMHLAEDTVNDFWRWAFGKLGTNNVRGVFTEWLVAKLLKVPLNSVRNSWDEYDLVATNGVTIEVKSSAYLQTWQQKGNSKIVFSNLRNHVPDATKAGGYAEPATYNADVYVFCIQIESDPDQWDATDLNQWRFFILPKAVLEKRGTNSLSLSVLASLTDELTADQFRNNATKMIRSLSNK